MKNLKNFLFSRRWSWRKPLWGRYDDEFFLYNMWKVYLSLRGVLRSFSEAGRRGNLNFTNFKSLFFIFSFFIFFVGCAVGPNYRTPDINSPAKWSVTPAGIIVQSQINSAWWKTFNDPQLDSLIIRAAASNLDLRQATERLQQARAFRSGALWDLFPVVNINTSVTREQRSQTSQLFPIPLVRNNLYDAGFDASWEFDIFGGARRALQAADANVAAARENIRDVLITVISEVARNYVEYRGYQKRLEVLQENITAQTDTLELTRSLFKAGINSQLDVEQAAAQLATTKSQQPTLDTLARQNEYQLAILLGLHPAELLNELSATVPIPSPPPNIPVGLPSELLRRRPDIRRAERNLAQATANIGVAVAEYFPQVSLLGTAGYQSLKSDMWFQNNSRYWSIAPQVSWRILDFGHIRAQVKAANSFQRQSLAAYEQTILVAFQDVENSLIAYTNERIRYDRLAEAVEANRNSLKLAKDLYSNGIGDFLSVLIAQQTLFQNEDQFAASRSLVIEDLVALYKALGGGWQPDVSPLPAGLAP
jgi:NodT family efflux transporter outer membrane factor (OMF) lipoprotein